MSKVRPAAGVIPVRRQADHWQVYLVQRGRHGRFFPGFHAFPGGVQEGHDADLLQCAARELWEECGLWIGPVQPNPGLRQEWLSGHLPWSEVTDLYPLHREQLLPAGVRTTPDYALVRFRAQFYLWDCPTRQLAEVWPGELEEGRWWCLEEALAAWRHGQIFLAPPTQDSLTGLSESTTLEEAAARLSGYPEDTADPIRIMPGVSYVPLITPTLPPARHTLCFLLGHEKVLLVDPGPADLEQMARVEKLAPQVQAVLLTHHHPDHVSGVARCRQLGWPIWAHRRTGELLDLVLDREIEDGQVLGDWTALHTPGHASGHLALWHDGWKVLLCGDLASGVSTILVPAPDGNMGDYLESLRRCQNLKPKLVLPSHGGPFGPGSDLLGQTLKHRLERESRVLQALGGTLEQVLAVAYADVSGPPLEYARISLLAHLEKLRRDGKAQLAGERWLPA
ncbi:MAG: MBL fold metallo-hydrolase [Candidatus Eremiobacteraeota bacterium]|nr:MBL fold metallo-hydrolase [Candidatus Eremiobacteraeota bacterium]MCW5870355.1 MBL fold metallo-hydrolase [Candidatus Eremiobacteraeota bacterium]